MDNSEQFLVVLGKTIRGLRIERKFSQDKLSDLACIHRTYLSDLENGKRYVTIPLLLKICKALDITISEIMLKTENDLKKLK